LVIPAGIEPATAP